MRRQSRDSPMRLAIVAGKLNTDRMDGKVLQRWRSSVGNWNFLVTFAYLIDEFLVIIVQIRYFPVNAKNHTNQSRLLNPFRGK